MLHPIAMAVRLMLFESHSFRRGHILRVQRVRFVVMTCAMMTDRTSVLGEIMFSGPIARKSLAGNQYR
jgi:hypothetical protein